MVCNDIQVIGYNGLYVLMIALNSVCSEIVMFEMYKIIRIVKTLSIRSISTPDS